jgi:hypothetical protein
MVQESWDIAFNIVAHNMIRGMKDGKSGTDYKEEKKCTIQ